MQKLHLVGFTAEFDGLIFSTRKGAKSGNYVVPIDGRLLKQIAEAERRRESGPSTRSDGHRQGSPRLVRPESSLNPREMQDRIRAGWSLDEVAVEAGVDLDWVSRFAAPVLAEVRRVIDQARDLVYDKPRVGLSALPLGASVRRNVLDRGVQLIDEEEFDGCWSAYQLDEESWVVRFAYTSRGRTQEAEWRLDLETDELSSRNRLGSQLGHVAKVRGRRAAPVAPAPPKRARKAAPPSPPPAPAAPARPKAKKRVTAKRPAVSKRPAAKRPAAKRPAAKRPAAKRPAAKRPAKKAAPPRRATPRATGARKKAVTRPAKKRSKRERAAELLEAPTPPVVRRPVLTPPAPRPRPAPEPVFRGPLPAPPPMPVPAVIREAVAVPIGADDEPPQPGAQIDIETGIAHIDSRRSWHAPPATGRPQAFRNDAASSNGDPPRRPRLREPLRGR